jgi:3-dehydroquinate dehydratase-2
MARLLLLNGPNLNLLGSREPAVYGHDTLASIEARLTERARKLGHTVEAFQSNAEHELIQKVQRAATDAFLAVKVPFIEVHLSNIFARESFRHHSYFSDIAVGCIFGLGAQGYELALEAAAARLASGQ